MGDYALVDENGLVVNVIVWDGTLYDKKTAPNGWAPPVGLRAVSDPDRQGVIGGSYSDGKFYPPVEQ